MRACTAGPTTVFRPVIRRGARAAFQFLGTYVLFFVVVMTGLLASWPGWYSDVVWQSIATNVFATFLVLPVLILGIDRAVEVAQRRRQRPRDIAVLIALRDAISRTVNLGATGTDPAVLPDVKKQVQELFRATNDVAACNVLIADEVLDTAEYVRAARRLTSQDLVHVIQEVAAERFEGLTLLSDARDALSPEQYAKAFKGLRSLVSLMRTGELMQVSFAYDPAATTPGSVALRESAAVQLGGVVKDLASVALELHSLDLGA